MPPVPSVLVSISYDHRTSPPIYCMPPDGLPPVLSTEPKVSPQVVSCILSIRCALSSYPVGHFFRCKGVTIWCLKGRVIQHPPGHKRLCSKPRPKMRAGCGIAGIQLGVRYAKAVGSTFGLPWHGDAAVGEGPVIHGYRQPGSLLVWNVTPSVVRSSDAEVVPVWRCELILEGANITSVANSILG